MELDPAQIPTMQPKDRTFKWGPVFDQESKESWLNVNGSLAGLNNIADAARLVEALMPPADTYPSK